MSYEKKDAVPAHRSPCLNEEIKKTSRKDSSWPWRGCTPRVGMAVPPDTKAACSHCYGAARLTQECDNWDCSEWLMWHWLHWIRSEKAIVHSIRQQWGSKCVSEQSGSRAVSAPHGPSRAEQSTMSSLLLRPSLLQAHWWTVCIKGQGMDFVRTIYPELCVTIQCIEKKYFLLQPLNGQ